MRTTWYHCTCCNRGWVKKVDRGSESVNGPRQRLFPFTGIEGHSVWVMLGWLGPVRLAKPSKLQDMDRTLNARKHARSASQPHK